MQLHKPLQLGFRLCLDRDAKFFWVDLVDSLSSRLFGGEIQEKINVMRPIDLGSGTLELHDHLQICLGFVSRSMRMNEYGDDGCCAKSTDD